MMGSVGLRGLLGKCLKLLTVRPDPTDMEARIERLEADMGDLKVILGRLEPAISRIANSQQRLAADVQKVALDVAELKGRLSQLPTTVQMIGFVLAVLIAGGVLKHFLG